ncbi:hypothetical protein EDC01DRAFT_91164 [Geopyxis carbonaria]|nr:hypothetical protein EDC01DRAFT_91164 [Geopyxis carbonaria]
MSVKALLNYVLEEVAIDGEKGTSIQQLFNYVNDFYVKNRQERHEIGELCLSDRQAATANSGNAQSETQQDGAELQQRKEPELWGLPNVKEEFQEYIWELLKREKDFSVGPKNEGGKMTLKEVVEKLKSSSTEEDMEWRVYATEGRRWRVLTGHGPDPKRVPNALFKCLEVIGKHREAGLIQPELTKLTGQDKRSIATRTTALKDLGYIEKIGVLARSMSTSKLTLTKFATIRDLKRTKEQKEAGSHKKGKKPVLGRENWTGEIIHTEGLINAIIVELKASKSGVLLRNDLKTKLGMDKSRFHWRSLSRILRRVESLGIWRRIRVPLNLSRTYRKKEGEGEQVVAERCHARCLRFLRDPTDEDWRKIASSSRAEISIEDEDDADDGSDAEDGKRGKDNADIDADAANALAKVNVDAVEEIARELPAWNVNFPVANIIYDLVNATGTTGLSSMEVVSRAIGAFYYRPMDQILHRLTDFPSISQPAQYIHLAVIRETSITQRQTHYRYFSYPAHRELVKEGLAVEPWGSEQKKKGSKMGSVGGQSGVPIIQDVDQFGFPKVDTSRLAKKDSSATLAESQYQGQKKENASSYTGQFTVQTNRDGTQCINWKNTAGRTGRPRKYEKGKEPYLQAKRRKEASMEVEVEETGKAQADVNMDTPVPVETEEATKKRSFDDGPGEAAADTETLPPSSKRRGRPVKAAPKPKAPPKPRKSIGGKRATPAKGPQKQMAITSFIKPVAPVEASEATPTPAPEPEPTPAPDVQKTPTPIPEPEPARAPEQAPVTPAPTGNRRSTRKSKTPVAPPSPAVPRVTRSSRKRKASTPIVDTRQDKHSKDAEVEADAVMVDPSEPADAQPVEASSTQKSPCPQPATVEDSSLVPSPNFAAVNDANASQAEVRPEVEARQPQDAAEVPAPSEESPPVPSKEPTPAQTHTIDGTLVEIEDLEGEGNDSYNSIGGMLALGRQQVVLQLVAENNGVFPAGLELRHAFNKRYQDMNRRAGIADRRLVRGIVQSLQYKGKVNQITFTFENSRGVQTTKKLLLDANTSIDSPQVTDMIREIKAADGNLWFPAGTALHADIKERMLQPSSHMQPKPIVVEGVEFDRLYPSPLELLRKKREQRAAERASRNAEKEEERKRNKEVRAVGRRSKKEAAAAVAAAGASSHWVGKFTEEQKQEARRRKAEIKAQSALYKLNSKFHMRNFSGDPQAPDENAPKSVWWNDYVDRTDGKTFHDEVDDVRQWELAMTGAGKDQSLATTDNSPVMINHFGPLVEKGSNFVQAPIGTDEVTGIIPIAPKKRGRKKGSSVRFADGDKPKRAPPTKKQLEPLIDGQPIKRKRRSATKKVRGPSRRELAMAAIHDNTLEKADDGNDLQPKKESAHRNTFTIPKADEDTLLIAVIIARTLFGNVERKINWDLVQKAAPQHEAHVLRGRWPRVRDVHKPHLKRLQSEFEEMYLKAYSKGELPPINQFDPTDFDLRLHVNWFRDNLELPEANTVPELSAKRETFDNLYTLQPERNTVWRADYHLPTATMGNRANNFVCYAYEVPIHPEKEDNSKLSVEFAKSIIRANIITDSSKYNAQRAFELLRAQPEEAVDEAFYDLTYNKVIAHKKEHSRAAPGRNYELTDKFHLSLRTPMDEKVFAQAVGFYQKAWNLFSASDPVILSPFMNDGSVACVFDMLAHGRVRLIPHDYTANIMGLIDGYETRGMPKHLVDFKLEVKPVPDYISRITPPPLPPVPSRNPDDPTDPIRLWFDIEGGVVKGMWLRVLTAALSLVVGRPAITTAEMTKMLKPGMTLREAQQVVEWLMERRVIEARDCGAGVMGYWAKEAYYLGLQGL